MSTAGAAHVRKDAASQEEASLSNPHILEAAREILLQGLGLLFVLNDQTYSRFMETPFGTSIGNHYRQVVEHFQCLIRGFPAGELDYDARERNARLEREVTYASVVTCDVLRALKRFTPETLARRCKVVCDRRYAATTASQLDSNVSQELAHCAAQAVHHYAIIRLLCGTIGIQVPTDFASEPLALREIATLATQ
jgi:hypothetical protein